MQTHESVIEFLRAAGRKGGLAKSAKKALSSRENGNLGGRPRKEQAISVQTNATNNNEKHETHS